MLRTFSSLVSPRKIIVAVLFSLYALSGFADDTDIFFKAQVKTPNILFVIDNSFEDSLPITFENKTLEKFDVYKILLQRMMASIGDNANVGLMRFDEKNTGVMIHPIENIANSDVRSNINYMLENIHNIGQGDPIPLALLEAGKYFRGNEATNAPLHCRISEGNTSEVNICEKNSENKLNYLAPSSNCTQNFIVLITGGGTNYNFPNAIKKAKEQEYITQIEDFMKSTPCISADCGPEIAEYLFKQNQIITYTIGIGVKPTSKAASYLNQIAKLGSTETMYNAENFSSLTNSFYFALRDIYERIAIQNSFVAPATLLSQSDSMVHDDKIYLPLLLPDARYTWQGNLMKYKVDPITGKVWDKDNSPVYQIDPLTKNYQFNNDSVDYWQSEPINKKLDFITRGGAESQIKLLNRPLYWNTKDNQLVKLDDLNAAKFETYLTENKLLSNLNSISVTPDQATSWIMGSDITSESESNKERHKLGDIIHSPPTAVTFNNKNYVIVGSNDGMLHIFGEDGTEKFSFMPNIMLEDLHLMIQNDVSLKHHYGVDGQITPVLSADRKTLYVYFGLRRGGNYYYALKFTDLENSSALPDKLEWAVTQNNSDFQRLGQTWSRAVPAFLFGKNVLVFTGGYDEKNDSVISRSERESFPSSADLGNDIYIIDQDTGAVEWSTAEISNFRWLSTFKDKMRYSFASSPKLIDIDGDGKADQMYAADTGGQLWRFDIHHKAKIITGGLIADLSEDSGSEYRRFYNTPDVSIISNGSRRYLAIGIGSGWREAPTNTSIQDYFFVIRQSLKKIDEDYSTKPITPQDLLNVPKYNEYSKAEFQAEIDKFQEKMVNGWKYKLDLGEKVFGDSLTLNNKVIFSTIVPSNEVLACGLSTAQLGTKFRIYLFDIRNTVSFYDFDNNEKLGEGGCDGDRCQDVTLAVTPALFMTADSARVLLSPYESVDILGVGSQATFWRDSPEHE